MIVTSDIVNTLNTAFQLIQAGTNERVRQSEQLLAQLRDDVQYPKVLFDYLQSYEVSLGLRAAIEFKLWFIQYSHFDDYKAQYVQEVVNIIKGSIIQAYLNSATPLSHQIKEAIFSIATRDFPHQWPNLMSELNVCLIQPQYVLRTLKLVKKLTDKYTFSSRSDPLYEEIIITCDTLHNNLLLLAQSILQQLQSNENLEQSYKILKSLLRVFYNLNFQDLHPHFEDNLQSWMEFMKLVLRLQEIVGFSTQVFKCKGEALKCVLLYAVKYRDDFQGLIQVFSSEIWTVCTQTTNDTEGDRILQNALKYFKSLVSWSEMRTFFEGNIKIMVESLIVKNMQISKFETQMFNEEPQQFIETFFEQSDLDSRRAQAIDLYKSVVKTYPNALNQILQEFISTYIQSGMNNPEAEIILINLLIDGATSGFTAKDGTVDIQLNAELIVGYYQMCLKTKFAQIFELQSQNLSVESKFSPVLLSFYCRFLFYFRNIIDKNEIPSLAEIVCKLSSSKKPTLSEIAQYTTYALISIKTNVKEYANPTHYFHEVNITPTLQVILQETYNNVKQSPQLEQHSLKLVNSLITFLKADIFLAIQAIGELLLDFLIKAKEAFEFQNVHLVFEIIANVVDLCIQSKNINAANQLQEKILNQLDEMLRENKGDVTNFILQIYSLFLQIQNNASAYYQGLTQNFLDVNNWGESNQSIFPAYITYLDYWFRSNQIPVQQIQNILNAIVGHSSTAFTQLSDLLIKNNVQWVFCVIQIAFKQYEINLNNQPLISSKSKATHLNQKLINKEILMLLSTVSNVHGVNTLISECSKISPQLIESFLINEINIIKSISSRNERKSIFIMLSQLLFQTQFITEQTWNLLFQAIVENIYLKKRVPLKFLGKVPDREITSGSGFQPLKPILQQNINKINQDEDKYFCSLFKQYYSDPIVQQKLPVNQLINQQQQELISALIRNV